MTLSSGEAELYVAMKASTEGIGTQLLLQEIGESVNCTVGMDSSAAKGTITRTGCGSQTNQSWVQEAAAAGRVRYVKVDRS